MHIISTKENIWENAHSKISIIRDSDSLVVIFSRSEKAIILTSSKLIPMLVDYFEKHWSQVIKCGGKVDIVELN